MPRCEMCGREAELQEYTIKDSLGTRYRNLCAECAEKMRNEEEADRAGKKPAEKPAGNEREITREKKNDPTKTVNILLLTGGVFLAAAVVLYFISVGNEYGVANIQTTVFAAAMFVAAVVCFGCSTVIRALAGHGREKE